MPSNDDDSTIPTDNFEEDKLEYAFSELVKTDNSKEEFKEHIEEASFSVKTDNQVNFVVIRTPQTKGTARLFYAPI